MTMSAWREVFCLLDKALSPIYLSLSLIAIFSLVSPLLGDLASHGKSRFPISSSARTEITWRRLYSEMVHGESFLLPKRFFLHFYITGLLSTTAFYLYMQSFDKGGSNRNGLALVLLALHLMRRCWECARVHAWSPTSKMHVAGYALGIAHYLLLPMVFVNSRPACGNIRVESTLDWRTATLGAATCLWAQYEQYQHHCLLADLRKTHDSSRQNHKIPSKRWFRLVSCPHYLAEIIIYISFVLVLPSSESEEESDFLRDYQSIALLVWVVSNLTVSAIRSHDWYLLHFPEYANMRRKAIFPFLL